MIEETQARMGNRSLIEVQALMRQANVSIVCFDNRTPERCGILGGIIGSHNDAELSFSMLQITHVFGEPVSRDNLQDLAYRVGAPFMDMADVRQLSYHIANDAGSQLARIAQLAAIMAPAMLVMGDEASTIGLQLDWNSFRDDNQTRQFIQHLQLWMVSLLEEQGVDDADDMVEPWIRRIGLHLMPQGSEKLFQKKSNNQGTTLK